MPRRVLVLPVLLLAFLATASTAQAAISCRLNVVPTLSSDYAASFTKTATVNVRSKEGRSLVGLRVDLVTFGGQRLGFGYNRKSRTGRFGSSSVRIKLRYPLQPGKFTVVVTELRNASCGTPKKAGIVSLKACPDDLPIGVPKPPAGIAADYGDYLSFEATPEEGAFIDGLRAWVVDETQSTIGEAEVPALFGKLKVDLALKKRLATGAYQLRFRGRVRGVPVACGLLRKAIDVAFT